MMMGMMTPDRPKAARLNADQRVDNALIGGTVVTFAQPPPEHAHACPPDADSLRGYRCRVGMLVHAMGGPRRQRSHQATHCQRVDPRQGRSQGGWVRSRDLPTHASGSLRLWRRASWRGGRGVW